MRAIMAAAVAVVASPAVAAPLQCGFDHVSVCGPAGCRDTDERPVWLKIDFAAKQYLRCDVGDDGACQPYDMKVEQSGIYLNLNFADGPQGAKLSNLDRRILEVVSIMDTVIVSRGQCR